jgi:hypothetical protein
MSTRRVSAKEQVGSLLATIVGILGSMVVILTLINYTGGRRQNVELVDRLANELDDKDEDVRAAALEALGKIGDERAAPAIMKVIDRDDSLLEIAVASLKRIGVRPDYRTIQTEKPARSTLVDNVKSVVRSFVKRDPAVERLASLVLAGIVFLPIWRIGRRISRRYQPFLALGRLFDGGRGSIWVPRLARLFSYSTPIAVLYMSIHFAVMFVVDSPISGTDASPLAQQAAQIEMAGLLKDTAALNMLRHTLADPAVSPRLRWRAAYSLGRIGNRAPRDELLASLQDGDNRVRQFSAWALGNIFATPGEVRSETTPLVKKFCPGCGARLDIHGHFCPACGARVTATFARDTDEKNRREESNARTSTGTDEASHEPE